MTSIFIFVILVIVALLLLFIASLTSTIAAVDIFDSIFYNNSNEARTSYRYLTIAAALAWTSLVIAIITIIIAVVTGAISNIKISDAFFTEPNPTRNDLETAYRTDQELNSASFVQFLILLIISFITFVVFIVAILSVIAATNLSNMTQRDGNATSAYTQSIITVVGSLISVVFLIIVLLMYIGIRSYRADLSNKLKSFQVRSMTQLNLN